MTAIPWAAIVLAAGQGTRMGGAKVLLRLDGTALVRRHVQCLTQAGCAHVVVMVPDGLASCVRALLPPMSTASVAIRAADTASPAQSLRLAWQTLLREHVCIPAYLLVTPVDMLPVRISTLHVLLRALCMSDVATPRMGEKSGHPVALRAQVLLRAYGRDTRTPARTLRDIIAASGTRMQIDVDDGAVLSHFNAPDDLRALGYAYDFVNPGNDLTDNVR